MSETDVDTAVAAEPATVRIEAEGGVLVRGVAARCTVVRVEVTTVPYSHGVVDFASACAPNSRRP